MSNKKVPPEVKALMDINARNREFWAEVAQKVAPLIKDPELVREVVDEQMKTATRWKSVQGLNSLESDLLKTHHEKQEKAALQREADFGRPFKEQANKKRRGGPVRLAIERALKKNPELKNPQLWQLLKDKPPRGWTVLENRTGKYLEGPNAPVDNMGQ